jgi:hypothetical protein
MTKTIVMITQSTRSPSRIRRTRKRATATP